MVIPRFGNISYYDNKSYYGDNRASIEVGNMEVGYSLDEIVYTYLNRFVIYYMTPLIATTGGDSITLTGDGFINTPYLNCMFGNIMASSVYYYNRTTIKCGVPPITDTSLDYVVWVTLNGYEYQNFTNKDSN